MLARTHIVSTQTAVLLGVNMYQLPLEYSVPLLIGSHMGSLAPDVDSPNSIASQSLGIFAGLFAGLGHRQITHTIWVVLGFSGLFYLLTAFAIPKFILFLFLGFIIGYCMHLFEDSFSRAGIMWTYPLARYKRSRNGGFYKPRKFYKMYYTVGGKFEYALYHIFLVSYILLLYHCCQFWFI